MIEFDSIAVWLYAEGSKLDTFLVLFHGSIKRSQEAQRYVQVDGIYAYVYVFTHVYITVIFAEKIYLRWTKRESV